MSDYPSWSDERDTYADASWSSSTAPPPPPTHSHYGGGGGYPGSDAYPTPSAPRPPPGGYAVYENRGSAGYGSAGSGGAGGGYAASYGGASDSTYVAPAGAAKATEISYDTSSRDPAHLRARVFIGSLGRGPIVREDIIELCRPFGPLMAVTLFKQGYAFVQYEEAEDADNACEVLNGKRWKGVNIDVHLAMEGLVRKTLPQKRSLDGGRGGMRGGGMGGGGRGGAELARGGLGGAGGATQANVNDWPGANAAKRGRPATTTVTEEPYVDINEQNRKAATADNTTPDMIGSEMADTLICGTCRYVTADFITFREHRKKDCSKPKDSVEPPVLRCSSCGLRFMNAWKMLFHLTDFHRMQLFKGDYSEEAIEKARMEDEKYKNVSAIRMDAWRKEQEMEHTNTAFVVQPQLAATLLPPSAAAPTTAAGGVTSNGETLPAAGAASTENGGLKTAVSASFANDDDVDTFGGGKGTPVERVTTGADYDEDEEDDEDEKPSTIPSLC